jgi:hypothetical protein
MVRDGLGTSPVHHCIDITMNELAHHVEERHHERASFVSPIHRKRAGSLHGDMFELAFLQYPPLVVPTVSSIKRYTARFELGYIIPARLNKKIKSVYFQIDYGQLGIK